MTTPEAVAAHNGTNPVVFVIMDVWTPNNGAAQSLSMTPAQARQLAADIQRAATEAERIHATRERTPHND